MNENREALQAEADEMSRKADFLLETIDNAKKDSETHPVSRAQLRNWEEEFNKLGHRLRKLKEQYNIDPKTRWRPLS